MFKMLDITSVTIGGTCRTRADEVETAYFNASYSKNGNLSVSKSIVNKDAYENNKEQIESDFAEFEKKSVQYINSMDL